MASLDRVHSLSAIEGLEARAEQFAEDLAVHVRAFDDAALTAALRHIDDTASRVMRILLDHALAADTSIAPPTRKVFAATVLDYIDQLPLLADRVRDLAARGRAPDPKAVVDAVVSAARRTHTLREALRAPVLALVQSLARSAIPDADRHARDRNLGNAERMRWSRVRRDLEAIAAQPTAILAAPLDARLAAWPEQIDEPAPEREPTLAELIELD